MNTFQVIATPVAAALFLRAAGQLARGVRPRWWPLASSLIWLGAGVAILWPDLTTRIAHVLGIGRGADLVIYVVTILFLASFFYMLQRFRRLETELTLLVRQLALRDAEPPDGTRAASASAPASPRTAPATGDTTGT